MIVFHIHRTGDVKKQKNKKKTHTLKEAFIFREQLSSGWKKHFYGKCWDKINKSRLSSYKFTLENPSGIETTFPRIPRYRMGKILIKIDPT